MKIDKAAVSASKQAEVTITVTRFKDVFVADACGTEYTMKMRKKHPRVRVEDDNIYVERPGATIRFTVASSTGDKEKYYPVGITFVRESKCRISDQLRLGMLNFAQRQIRPDGRSLTITDSYKDYDPDPDVPYVRYKFSLVIQRGSDGATGIIDPGIIHEN